MTPETINQVLNQIGDAGCLVVSLFFLLQTVKAILPMVEKMADQHDRHVSQLIKLVDLTKIGIAENEENR